MRTSRAAESMRGILSTFYLWRASGALPRPPQRLAVPRPPGQEHWKYTPGAAQAAGPAEAVPLWTRPAQSDQRGFEGTGFQKRQRRVPHSGQATPRDSSCWSSGIDTEGMPPEGSLCAGDPEERRSVGHAGCIVAVLTHRGRGQRPTIGVEISLPQPYLGPRGLIGGAAGPRRERKVKFTALAHGATRCTANKLCSPMPRWRLCETANFLASLHFGGCFLRDGFQVVRPKPRKLSRLPRHRVEATRSYGRDKLHSRHTFWAHRKTVLFGFDCRVAIFRTLLLALRASPSLYF